MSLERIIAKLLSFLPSKVSAEPPPIPSIYLPKAEAKHASREREFVDGCLPVTDEFIENAFSADFRSAKHQGDTIRLSALRALQRNVVRHASSGDGFVKLCRKRFKVVVQECIEQSREVAQIFRETGDPELALQEDKEIAVLEAYLAPRSPEPEAPTQPAVHAQKPTFEAKPQARQQPDATAPAKAYTRSLSCSKCQTSARNWLFRHDADTRPFPSSPNYQSKKTGRMIVLCPDCLSAARASERFANDAPAGPASRAARTVKTQVPSLVCAQCRTSSRNWFFRSDAERRPFPQSPNHRSKKTGLMVVLCPDCFDAVGRRYEPAPSSGGFQWRGPGYCQHCNRRAMPGGDVCYSCNPD